MIDNYEEVSDVVEEIRVSSQCRGDDVAYVFCYPERRPVQLVDSDAPFVIEPFQIRTRRVTWRALADRLEAAYNRFNLAALLNAVKGARKALFASVNSGGGFEARAHAFEELYHAIREPRRMCDEIPDCDAAITALKKHCESIADPYCRGCEFRHLRNMRHCYVAWLYNRAKDGAE